MHTILAVVLLLATPSGTWYEHYDRGLRLIEQGQGAAAIDVEIARGCRPGTTARTESAAILGND